VGNYPTGAYTRFTTRRSRLLGESVRSTFLFALPSWREGAGRLMDFGDSLTEYNQTLGPDDPDDRATRQDWLAVGDYLRMALHRGSGSRSSR
jgi:hypothetical protein